MNIVDIYVKPKHTTPVNCSINWNANCTAIFEGNTDACFSTFLEVL